MTPVLIDPASEQLRCALTRAVLTTFDADTRERRAMTDEEWAAAWPVVRHDPNTTAAVDQVLHTLAEHGQPVEVERGHVTPGPGGPETRPVPAGFRAATFTAGQGGRVRWVTPWRTP